MTAEEMKPAKSGPLSGIRVLDFSRVLSGPYATLILADLGADVIKIETTDKGDETRAFPPFMGPLSHYFIALNRGKKSLALDLKSDRGRDIARALARQSDVLVENFRPGVMDRLGLGYDVLSADNPGLCYCSISGFGADSPLTDKPAFDIVAQALSGAMSLNCEPGSAPTKLSIPLGDMAGSIFSVFGILAAIIERNATGKGRHIEVAMLDGMLGMLGYLAQRFFVTGKSPEPMGTRHPSIVPYGSYPTSDGYIIVACLTERFWHCFAGALGRPELATDPRFAQYTTRLENREALEDIVQTIMREHDTQYWLAQLDRHGVPNAPILDVKQALEQPHTQARGLIDTAFHPAVGEIRALRTPLRFGGEPLRADRPPPLLGEHSREILAQLGGLSQTDIDALIRDAIVCQDDTPHSADAARSR